MTELAARLNTKLQETFSGVLTELNKNVYPAAKTTAGTYEAPIVTLSTGGGTILVGKEDKPLENPAAVGVKMNEVEAFKIVYRLTLSRSEAEIADKNPAYFTYLFSSILDKAVANYQATVGGPDQLRFGSHYVRVNLDDMVTEPIVPGSTPAPIPDVEAAIPSPVKDASGLLVLRLDGDWAKVN